MKANNYLDSVLHHISGKRRKTAVRCELFDHLDEIEREYLHDGYDKADALSFAETAMGDADVVGEQLDAIRGSRLWHRLTALWFALTTVMTVLLDTDLIIRLLMLAELFRYPMLTHLAGALYRPAMLLASPSYYADVWWHNAVMVTVLTVNLLVCLRRKRPVLYGFGALYLLWHCWSYGAVLSALLANLFDGKNVFALSVLCEIKPCGLWFLCDDALRVRMVVINIVLTVLLLCLLWLGLRHLLRVRRLRNTPGDLKIKRAVTVTLSALLGGYLVLAAVMAAPQYCPQWIINAQIKEATVTEQAMLDNAAAYCLNRETDITAWMEQAGLSAQPLPPDNEMLQGFTDQNCYGPWFADTYEVFMGQPFSCDNRLDNEAKAMGIIDDETTESLLQHGFSLMRHTDASPYGRAFGVTYYAPHYGHSDDKDFIYPLYRSPFQPVEGEAYTKPGFFTLDSIGEEPPCLTFSVHSEAALSKTPLGAPLSEIPLPANTLMIEALDGRYQVTAAYEYGAQARRLIYEYNPEKQQFYLTVNEYAKE